MLKCEIINSEKSVGIFQSCSWYHWNIPLILNIPFLWSRMIMLPAGCSCV